jgi:hypothetical protein
MVYMSKPSKFLPFIFILTSLVFFAFLIRIFHLTILPVFADEAIYIRWAQVMSHEPTLRFLPLSDGKQPLFMWILMFLVYRMSDPLFMGRLVSVLSGIGTLVGVAAVSYVLSRSKKVSLVAALMWTIGPFAYFFDRMALVDALLTCCGVWTFLLAILMAKTKRWDLAMLTGFALGAGLLTKSPAIFFALLLPTTWLLSSVPKSFQAMLIHLARLAALFAVTLIIAFAMYNILRLGPNFQLIGSRNADYVYPITHILQSPLDPLKPHFSRSVEWLIIWGPSVIVILYLLGIVVLSKKNIKTLLVLLAWSIAPVVINSEYAKVFTARYILFCLPFIYITASAAWLTKSKKFFMLLNILLLIFVGHSLLIDYQLLSDPISAPIPRSERSGYLEEWTSGIGIREVAEYLKNEHAKDPNTQIVVGTEGYFGTLPDGLQMYMQGVPSVVVIGVGLNIDSVHPSLVESKKAGNKTYLVANSSRLKFPLGEDGKVPFEKYGLKVVAEYTKGDRPTDIKEYFWYGLHDTLYLFEVLPILEKQNEKNTKS